ncbi:hypothetical protein QVD17_16916 [Tagetes erecta]|uniref:Retrotransposon gag domain-containing protein n=1 Tax=Tagetes erecta TaxID=13708 RepID=A0AAD8NZX3_TARER|nr:hypothetical protein QVD17_16916 [Tagetes erecta]
MSTTPVTDIVEPSSEPERNLHRRLRVRSRLVAAAIEGDTLEDNTSGEEEEQMAEPDDQRTIADFGKPSLNDLAWSIERPTVEANNFEIKSSTIQMVQNMCQFDGKDHEDPNAHLNSFLEICATFKINGASDDAIRLRLFPFSLRDRAKAWLVSLPSGSITSWTQMAEKFLEKYFPAEKTSKLRARLHAFEQDDGESIHDAWERFKDLARKVPHHGLELWKFCDTFYNALEPQSQQLLDMHANGDFGKKRPQEAYDMLERVAAKSYSSHAPRSRTSRHGVHQVDSYTALTAQLEALSTKVDQMQVGQIAKLLSERPQGGLPGNTEANPKGHVKAITTRSGKTTEPVPSPSSQPVVEEEETESPDEVQLRRSPASLRHLTLNE